MARRGRPKKEVPPSSSTVSVIDASVVGSPVSLKNQVPSSTESTSLKTPSVLASNEEEGVKYVNQELPRKLWVDILNENRNPAMHIKSQGNRNVQMQHQLVEGEEKWTQVPGNGRDKGKGVLIDPQAVKLQLPLLQARKHIAMTRNNLEMAQTRLQDDKMNTEKMNDVKKLCAELLYWNETEIAILKQRAKVNWLKFGDDNSSFFIRL
ncbi:unnamed protein product [Vicia faba]|uniref:Uncharacterized protein n=1 Tax=Vicia faba TaxID=3906 RepID=A0AAV1A1P0_VICFA|nr:unnamed protein product [Vicia faba]